MMSNTLVIDVTSASENEECDLATVEQQYPATLQHNQCERLAPAATTATNSTQTVVKHRNIEVIVDDFNDDDSENHDNNDKNIIKQSDHTLKKFDHLCCHGFDVAVDKQGSLNGCQETTTISTLNKFENTPTTTPTLNKKPVNEKLVKFPSSDCLDNIQQLNILTNDTISEHCQNSPNKSLSNSNEKICRICLDNVDEGDLIAPCKCSGSTKYAHESCMLKWFFKSSKKSCEVCLGNVNVTPVGYKPVQEWRLPESGCDFIVYLFGLYFLIMVIFTGMITWIATQGCTSPVCVTLYCVCGIAVFYFFYCCGCVEYSRRYWKALLSVNKVWRIYGREDSMKNFKYNVQQVPDSTDANRPNVGANVHPFVIDINENEAAKKNNESKTGLQLGVDNYAVEIEEPGN